jgi:predicted PurR-regulated permease PerM
MHTPSSNDAAIPFQKKVWIAMSIAALFVVVIWLIKATFNVLLLLLAGALIALYFRGLGNLLHRKLHVPEKASLPVSVLGSLLLLGGFFWFAGSQIEQQVTELRQTLPAAIDNLKQQLGNTAVGQKLLAQGSQGNQTGQLSSFAKNFFKGTFGALGDIYVVLFLGLFFTASPRAYMHGLVQLVPVKARPRAREVIDALGTDLSKWLKGMLFAMLVVAILTGTGLVIMGVPMAFALALIAGILNFIPNFGPLIAMIPALLIGFMQGPVTAAMVAGLYIVVQVLESNLITPQIQKRLISIPPALIIIAQLFMGVLTGGWGLLLATPLMLILIVLVQKLYIDKEEKNQKK